MLFFEADELRVLIYPKGQEVNFGVFKAPENSSGIKIELVFLVIGDEIFNMYLLGQD